MWSLHFESRTSNTFCPVWQFLWKVCNFRQMSPVIEILKVLVFFFSFWYKMYKFFKVFYATSNDHIVLMYILKKLFTSHYLLFSNKIIFTIFRKKIILRCMQKQFFISMMCIFPGYDHKALSTIRIAQLPTFQTSASLQSLTM